MIEIHVANGRSNCIEYIRFNCFYWAFENIKCRIHFLHDCHILNRDMYINEHIIQWFSLQGALQFLNSKWDSTGQTFDWPKNTVTSWLPFLLKNMQLNNNDYIIHTRLLTSRILVNFPNVWTIPTSPVDMISQPPTAHSIWKFEHQYVNLTLEYVLAGALTRPMWVATIYSYIADSLVFIHTTGNLQKIEGPACTFTRVNRPRPPFLGRRGGFTHQVVEKPVTDQTDLPR